MESKIYRTVILQTSICRDEDTNVKYSTKILQILISRNDPSKVKYTKLKYCRCPNAETKKSK